MKLLYLIFLEQIESNPIIDSQVFPLLKKVSKTGLFKKMFILHMYPLITIGRSGIIFSPYYFRKNRNSVRIFLARKNIHIIFFPFIFPILKRTGIYFNIFLLPIFFLHSFIFSIFFKLFNYKTRLILHARSYLPTYFAYILSFFYSDLKYIFDPRGFYPEEGLERNLWKDPSISFSAWKYLEKLLLTNSSAVISLSDSFSSRIDHISKNAINYLIYTGVDTHKFNLDSESRNLIRKRYNLNERFVFAYSGGLGSWNCPYTLANLFREIKVFEENSYLFVFTNYDKEHLSSIFTSFNISKNHYKILHLLPSMVCSYLSACDFGVAPGKYNLNNDESYKVTNNTMFGLKISEYLASGLPLIFNSNIKTLNDLIINKKLGHPFTTANKTISIPYNFFREDNQSISYNCRYFAKTHLSMDAMHNSYITIYNQLCRNI